MTAQVTTKPKASTGRRIWFGFAIFVSLLVLLISAGGIIGTWVARGVVIDIGTATLTAIEEVAGIGRERISAIDKVVGEVRAITTDVESAVDEIAQDVSDKGLILTLLPPAKEQRIYDAGDRIGEAVASIRSVINAVSDLLEAIDSIPFVDLPMPDPAKVERMESEVQAFQDDLDQMGSDIQQFRDNAAGEISTVTAAASKVGGRLDTTRANLNEVDSSLADVQNRARSLRERFATIVTIIALVITLFLLWVAYGMVVLMRNYWMALRAPAQAVLLTANAQAPDEKMVDEPVPDVEPASEEESASETESASDTTE